VFNIADAETLLIRAFEQIPTDTPTAGTVKNKMLMLDPSFDQANYGCGSFRDFLTHLSHRVAPVGRSGQDITIALIRTPDAGDGRRPMHAPLDSDDAPTRTGPPNPRLGDTDEPNHAE
jgi:hypothetical protein